MNKILLLSICVIVAFVTPTAALAQFSEVIPTEINLALEPGESSVQQVSIQIFPFCIRPYQINVIASDPNAIVTNFSGVLENQCGGDTTAFYIQFTGDGTERSFDLQFVDNDFGGVLDTIPVTVVPPSCSLDLTLSLGRTGLEMGFDVGTPFPATWNVWMSVQSVTFLLWSAPLGVIDPPISFPLVIPGFPQLGTIGVLTTLTTPDEGIICSDLETVNTGTPADANSAAELRELFNRNNSQE